MTIWFQLTSHVRRKACECECLYSVQFQIFIFNYIMSFKRQHCEPALCIMSGVWWKITFSGSGATLADRWISGQLSSKSSLWGQMTICMEPSFHHCGSQGCLKKAVKSWWEVHINRTIPLESAGYCCPRDIWDTGCIHGYDCWCTWWKQWILYAKRSHTNSRNRRHRPLL